MSMRKGSKLASFHRVIVEAKLNLDAFEIILERDTRGSEGKGSLWDGGIGTIKVTYKPSGISSHYRDGVVPPPWLKFDLDLKGNLFRTQ